MSNVTVMHSEADYQCVQMSFNVSIVYQCCPNVTSMYQYLLRHWNRFNIFKEYCVYRNGEETIKDEIKIEFTEHR